MTTLQVKRFILPTILLVGLTLFFVGGAADFLNWQAFSQHYGAVKVFTNSHLTLSYGLFFMAYLLAVAFSLPIASLLTLGGGAVFGWPAALLIVTAATGGAGLVFLAAKSIFSDALRRRAGPFVTRLEAGFSENAFFYLLALRLVPAAPFWVVNIIPAFSEIRLSVFLAATAIGIIPGSVIYVGIGQGFDQILAAGQTPDLSVLTKPEIWLPLSGLGILVFITGIYRHIKSRKPKLAP